jgi:hypothetical protein
MKVELFGYGERSRTGRTRWGFPGGVAGSRPDDCDPSRVVEPDLAAEEAAGHWALADLLSRSACGLSGSSRVKSAGWGGKAPTFHLFCLWACFHGVNPLHRFSCHRNAGSLCWH